MFANALLVAALSAHTRLASGPHPVYAAPEDTHSCCKLPSGSPTTPALNTMAPSEAASESNAPKRETRGVASNASAASSRGGEIHKYFSNSARTRRAVAKRPRSGMRGGTSADDHCAGFTANAYGSRHAGASTSPFEFAAGGIKSTGVTSIVGMFRSVKYKLRPA
jgi:hypothetical protein